MHKHFYKILFVSIVLNNLQPPHFNLLPSLCNNSTTTTTTTKQNLRKYQVPSDIRASHRDYIYASITGTASQYYVYKLLYITKPLSVQRILRIMTHILVYIVTINSSRCSITTTNTTKYLQQYVLVNTTTEIMDGMVVIYQKSAIFVIFASKGNIQNM